MRRKRASNAFNAKELAWLYQVTTKLLCGQDVSAYGRAPVAKVLARKTSAMLVSCQRGQGETCSSSCGDGCSSKR